MGGALEMHIRSLIIEQLTKEGCSMIAVSKEHGLSYSTVRRLWKRYKAEGISGLKPHYDQCGSHALEVEHAGDQYSNGDKFNFGLYRRFEARRNLDRL